MSKQNKVNPGMYTQRGRLTQDDAARELRKMRQVGSQHTWQPTKKNDLPRFESKAPAEGGETTEDNGSNGETTSAVEARPASRRTKSNVGAKTTASANAKTSKSSAARKMSATKTTKATRTVKAKSVKTKSIKTAKRAAKSAPKRKAVLARNVGGGGATPRPTAKRRKS